MRTSRSPARIGIASPAALCWLTVVVAACSAGPPKLEAPTVRIVELNLASGSAALRIDNTVAAPLPATGTRLEILVDDALLGRFEPVLDLTIPPLGSELLEVRLDPSSPGARHLAEEELAEFRYQVLGEVAIRDEGALTVDSSGWLSPTPGKPGSFR